MTQQSNLLGWNGVKEICVVRLVGASLLKYLEGFAFWLGVNHHCTGCQVCEGTLATGMSALLKQFSGTLFVTKPASKPEPSTLTSSMVVFCTICSRTCIFQQQQKGLEEQSSNTFFALVCACQEVARVSANLAAFGVRISSSSAQCKDDEASDKMDLRHEHADTPKLKACLSFLEQKMLKKHDKFPSSNWKS